MKLDSANVTHFARGLNMQFTPTLKNPQSIQLYSSATFIFMCARDQFKLGKVANHTDHVTILMLRWHPKVDKSVYFV